MTTENIKQRLSLRKPLQEALDILAQLAGQMELSKEPDLAAELEKIRGLFPTCTDFERAFPSLCFSIATGVGKTRLMGACIAWLHLQKGIKNFFVLAPNLTVYDKLIEDFGNPGNPKYVFRGLAEFVHNKPVIITGDNYAQASSLFGGTEIRINIFNVSKFARETKPVKEGGKNMTPKIKRLSEYLGQSYWEYLSGLNDLVILMDEAHRYHADKSKEAINELKPVLGIEMTATPIDEKQSQFRNVVYEYSLAQALTDGLYVKNPTIAKRKDFDPAGKSAEETEKIKLEDAVSIHEDTKQALRLYALNAGKRLVKPFILVVCRDTAHAKTVSDYVASAHFYGGMFAGKVLQIDSTTRNEEAIEQQFLSLESDGNEIEIVIHVNMLKEGWDVTNLYTIVPLRAANAAILVEQTIGRGLRLPFGGERTGEDKIDKLTIVAHDNFDAVIAAAQDPNSVLNKMNFVEIGAEQLSERQEVVTSPGVFQANLDKDKEAAAKAPEPAQKQSLQNVVDAKQALANAIPLFNSHSAVKKLDDLMKPEVKAAVLAEVEKGLNAGQINLFAGDILQEAKALYEKTIVDFKKNIIEIPRMELAPFETISFYEDFDLDASGFGYAQLNDEILRMGLKDRKTDTIEVIKGVFYGKPEEMLLTELLRFPEIDYDTDPALLRKLIGQSVNALQDRLKPGENLADLVFQWRGAVAKKIYGQMLERLRIKPCYQKPSVKPFTRLSEWNFTALKNEGRKHYRDEAFPAAQVPKFVFVGFEKSCHFEYKFDSRTEQTLSGVLETDQDVLKWLRPAPDQFRIYWHRNSKLYRPDFVAETANGIYLLEAKAANETDSGETQAKAEAALKYCGYATEFTEEFGGKPWKYALIPHDHIAKTSSFKRLVANII